MVGGNSPKNEVLQHANPMKSKHCIRIQPRFHYVLPMVASCYKGKPSSCDRLGCILPTKFECLLFGLLWTGPKQATICAIPDNTTRGHLGPTSGAQVGPVFVSRHMTDFSLYTTPNCVAFLTEHLQEMKLPIHCSTVQKVSEFVNLDLQLFGNQYTHFYVLYKLSFQVRIFSQEFCRGLIIYFMRKLLNRSFRDLFIVHRSYRTITLNTLIVNGGVFVI